MAEIGAEQTMESSLASQEIQGKAGELIKEVKEILNNSAKFRMEKNKFEMQETNEIILYVGDVGKKVKLDIEDENSYVRITRTTGERTPQESSQTLTLQDPKKDHTGQRTRPIVSFQSNTDYVLDKKSGLRKPLENTARSFELAVAFKEKLKLDLLAPTPSK